MRVALTGGTGFIGNRVVRQLRERGHDVVCVVRRPEAAASLTALGATLHKGDILDKKSLEAAFAGCDGVIHLAASYELGVVGKAAQEALDKNLVGTRAALEAARDAGAKKIVYTSSIVVHGTTRGAVVDESFHYTDSWFPTFYAMTKHRAHYEIAVPLMKAGAPIVIVQPGAVCGPRDHSTMRVLFRWAARGWPVPVGGARYGVVDVEECARGHVLALENGTPGECYHLVQENLAFADIVRNIAKETGVGGWPLTQPDFLLKIDAAFMGLVERVLPVPDWLSSDAQRGLCSDVTLTVSSAKANEQLGWKPRPLADAYREIVKDELTRMGKKLPAQLTA